MVKKSPLGDQAGFAPWVVPKLYPSAVAIGLPDEARWELKNSALPRSVFPVGEVLELKALLKEQLASAAAAVRIVTNLGHGPTPASFHTLELQREAAGSFVLNKSLERAGRFYVYGQYTLDGEHWFWMRGAPLLFIVYPAQLRGLRMYIMIPNASGPLTTWPAQLQSIAAMGFNMVHLLPLTLQGHSQSPYAARDLFRLEPDLIDPQDPRPEQQQWEDFVLAAQEQGMGLCLDLVLNHVSIDSELVQLQPNWIIPDPREADGLKRAGYMAADHWEKWNDLVLINYAHPDPETRKSIWNYFHSYSLYWARYAAASGGMVRLDNLHSTHSGFASALTSNLRQAFPHLGILGEFFGSHERLLAKVQNDEIDLMLATPWEHHFTHELRRYLRYLHETSPLLPWFCPLNSHDSGTPAQEFASVQSTRPRYLVSALLGTGATGLSQGVERGLLEKINFIGRQPALKFATDQEFVHLIRQVNELLAKVPNFQQGAKIHFVDHDHTAVLAAIRYCEDRPAAMVYLVIANMDIHNTQSITIDLFEPLLKDRHLRDYFTGQDIPAPSPAFNLQLEPCGVRVISASSPSA